jgi:hypothetical protein
MAFSAAAQVIPAVFVGGHTTEPYWVAIPILVLFFIMRVMRARGGGTRGRGPGGGTWGSGSTGSGSTEDPPIQWDIRKPAPNDSQPSPPPPADAPLDMPSEEHNPPSDL